MRCSRSLIRLRRFGMPVSESRSAASFSSRCDERSVTAPNPSSSSAPISIAISETPRLSYQPRRRWGRPPPRSTRFALCGWRATRRERGRLVADVQRAGLVRRVGERVEAIVARVAQRRGRVQVDAVRVLVPDGLAAALLEPAVDHHVAGVRVQDRDVEALARRRRLAAQALDRDLEVDDRGLRDCPAPGSASSSRSPIRWCPATRREPTGRPRRASGRRSDRRRRRRSRPATGWSAARPCPSPRARSRLRRGR